MKRDQARKFKWHPEHLIGVICAGPNCNNPVADGAWFYCENPNCRKAAWYKIHNSAQSRKSLTTFVTSLENKLDALSTLIESLPQQLSLFPPSTSGRGAGGEGNTSPSPSMGRGAGGGVSPLPMHGQASSSSPLPMHGEGQGVGSETQPTRAISDQQLDDIDLQITRAKSTANNNPTYNFLIASAINVYGNYDNLPRECIAYGLNTGKIQPHQVNQTSPSPNMGRGSGGGVSPLPMHGEGQGVGSPKQMNVPAFAAPDIEIEDELLEGVFS